MSGFSSAFVITLSTHSIVAVFLASSVASIENPSVNEPDAPEPPNTDSFTPLGSGVPAEYNELNRSKNPGLSSIAVSVCVIGSSVSGSYPALKSAPPLILRCSPPVES